VLDQFAGSGTTILAAEKVGRIGFGTLPINWRGVATTDPELAVEAVRGGASRTTSTGFSWIPAYGQKIDPRSNSLFGRENSLFGKNNSLFRRKNSLFHLLGNFAASI
jgi:hypothetical protein